MPPTSVLIITASPDGRRSTQMLRDTVEVLGSRDDVRVETWFLRSAWDERPWPGSKVVDDLRSWAPAALLDHLGLDIAAGRVRGLRLRTWLRRLSPDIVVLDDGLGERVVTHLPPDVVRLVRRNRQLPSAAAVEDVARHRPAAVIVPPGTETDPLDAPLVVEFETRDDWAAARAAGEERSRSAARTRLGVPHDVPIVTGWGDDGWIDGPDVFVRALWALEHRHGVRAHGVWFGSDGDVHERLRLRAEAERCGVGDRFQQFGMESLGARLCGDAVFLPYRDSGDDEELLVAICAGSGVVTFPVTSLSDPSLHVVDHLDVEAAASALDHVLAEDRDARWSGALRRLDLQAFADEILSFRARGRG